MSAHRKRRRGRLALLTAGGLVAGLTGAALMATSESASAESIRAAYQTVSSWDTGFTGQYTLTNTGTETVHGWTLAFDLPAGTTVSSLWNGAYTENGRHVQVENASWNGDIAPGASAVVGFVASGTASDPSACRINGAACSGGGAPAPSPTTTSARPTATPKPSPTAKPPAGTPTPAPPKGGRTGFAPYVDVGLYPPFDLTGAARRTGVTTYTLAFVVSGGGCTPRWGGVQALGDNDVAKRIGALRDAGGDVRVSFGGANGTELAQACTNADQLASAYRQVIDTFQLTKVDFDVEGAAIADTAANDRRAQAIATLQRQVRGLDVSFTLPVLPGGLTQDGVNLLANAKKNGVDVSAVNIMAMDYGDGQAPNPDGRMGDYAIQAATSTHTQIERALGLDDTTAWHRLAVTPMIGVNDTASEVFRPADAAKVAAFARQKGLAWLSMWSATRDRQCPGGAKNSADATCSSILQDDFAFTKAFTS